MGTFFELGKDKAAKGEGWVLPFISYAQDTVGLQPLKCQTKIAADDTSIFYFHLSKKIKLDVSCESSAKQRIHMKHQGLFSLKNEKVFMNVVCCSCDWRFKG